MKQKSFKLFTLWLKNDQIQNDPIVKYFRKYETLSLHKIRLWLSFFFLINIDPFHFYKWQQPARNLQRRKKPKIEER